ncbi:AraC family transcriptional regulator [uncultured Tenacibaculum sp.]|uniref:helix-turn-helix domain-containing protein n=1 Tax=uncultured Tenacibaculum sp. TaxID=174713 RepID=UPI00260422AA|nr:AraC family transcriptional regulator [uncultured Tenacibaculum sp.]
MFVLAQDFVTSDQEDFVLEATQDQPVFLLQFVFNGDALFSLEDCQNSEFKIQSNMHSLLYLPNLKYSITYLKGKSNVLAVYFTESFLKDKMGTAYLESLKNYEEAKEKNLFCAVLGQNMILNNKLRDVVNELINCSFKGVARKSYLEVKLTEIVLLALQSSNLKSAINKLREEDKEVLVKIENYIQNNLHKDLTIEKLSVLAGFNTSKFKSAFKQFYGVTVFKYITSLRLEKAKELIVNNNYTVAQASYEVGYKNPQHFTVAFKKKLGYLPSQLLD